jgi:hypothetical protein
MSLPFRNLSNSEFNEINGSRRRRRGGGRGGGSGGIVAQHRYNLRPRRRTFNRTRNWVTEQVPLVEDPIFTRRYESSYTGSGGLNLPSQMNSMDWRPYQHILNSFYLDVIQPILTANGGSRNIGNMRLYILSGRDNQQIIVREQNEPVSSAWLQPGNRGFHMHIKRVLRETIVAYLLRGISGDTGGDIGNVDSGSTLNNMNQLIVRIDIQTLGGGVRNSKFAQGLLNQGVKKAWLFNPADTNEFCLLACIDKFARTCGLAFPTIPYDSSKFGRCVPVKESVAHLLQEYLPEVYICVLDLFCQCIHAEAGPLFVVENPDSLCITLMLVEEHYYLVLKAESLFMHFYNQKLWCCKCHRVADSDHDCTLIIACDLCGKEFENDDALEEHQVGGGGDIVPLQCMYCNRKGFYNMSCVNRHMDLRCLKKGKAKLLIEQKKRYETSEKGLQTRKAYADKFWHCKGCNKRRVRGVDDDGHQCCLKAKKDYTEVWEPKMYTFDMETESCPHPENENYRIMEVNLICVREMYGGDDTQEYYFESLTEFVEFLDYLALLHNTESKKHLLTDESDDGEVEDDKVVFYAHNLSKFDGRILAEGIYAMQADGEMGLITDQTCVGRKLLQFSYKGIVFRDSLLHLKMSVGEMPKVFDFQNDVVKGFFPHHLNSLEYRNLETIACLPDIVHWDLSMKKKKDADEILKWYHKTNEYLAKTGGTWNRNKELLKYCFDDCRVLARALETYNDAGKAMFGPNYPPLRQLTIAGYTKDVFWRKFLDVELLPFHHRREYDLARSALRGGRTDVRRFYDCITKDQYFQAGKRIIYQDVCSLYPYVMVDRPYPTGGVKWYTDPTIDDLMNAEFGFAEIDIDPPPFYQHHPPLPCTDPKRMGRLTATLERKTGIAFCLQEIHKAVKQGWRITRVHKLQTYTGGTKDLFKPFMSILMAEKVHASSDYDDAPPEEWQELVQRWNDTFGVKIEIEKIGRNPGKKQLFKTMLNSLWGKLCERLHTTINVNCTTEQLKSYYSFEKNGFLDIKRCDRLGPNRWLLNADITGMEIDDITPQSLTKFVEQNPGVDIEDIDCQPYNATQSQRNYLWVRHLRESAVHIGAYVTMWGRSVLEEQMEKLDQRVLYHDTDSIIYKVEEPNDYQVPRGKLLGEWEIECDTIIEFVSLAPKVYAYKYLGRPVNEEPDSGEFWFNDGLYYPILEVCKAKGFTLHQKAAEHINFQGLKQLYFNTVRNGREYFKPISVPQFAMKYDEQSKHMLAYNMAKRLTFHYEKGVIGKNHTAYPFGSEQYWDAVHMYADSAYPLRTLMT